MIYAGIDYRGEVPVVCYQTTQMPVSEFLPLDFSGQIGKSACFRKILSALKRFGKKEEIQAAVVLSDMSEEGIHGYLTDACEAGFLREQLQVLGEMESVVHFVMHQTNDIWQQRVWLLEFDAEEIKATVVEVNKRTTPMLVRVKPSEYWYVGSLLDGNQDERIAELAEERFGEKQVSAVFLSGTDFNPRDYKKSREVICYRRRVFLGEQIHARGACVAATTKEQKKSYLYLNEQTLLYNVGIRSIQKGEESVYTLISAGCNWYEAQVFCEMLLAGDPVLELVFQPMMGGEPILAGMMLTDIPSRPSGASRILVEMHFSRPMQCEIKVTDLGFGELYPASDLYWEETLRLDAIKEDMDGSGYHL